VTSTPPRPADREQFLLPFDLGARRLTVPASAWSVSAAHPSGNAARGTAPARERFGFDFEPSERGIRPLLGREPGRAAGVLLSHGARSLLVSNNGSTRSIGPGCAAKSGYIDARGRAIVTCAARDAATRLEALEPQARELLRAPAAAHYRDRSPGLRFFPPGEPIFVNADAVAVGHDGRLAILRLPPGDEPPTVDNPAWLLSSDAAPVALAPWSSLEPATSPACATQRGHRAVIQTERAWFDVVGATSDRDDGMSALVRWDTERICLEAIQIGFGSVAEPVNQPARSDDAGGVHGALRISAVARFTLARPEAAFVAADGNAQLRERATCDLQTR